MLRGFATGSIQMLFLATLQVTFFVCPQTTWAKDAKQLEAIVEDASREGISAIDRSLLLELIKLARFNIHFHQEANRHQQWRALTYAAGRESGTAVSFASSLVDLNERVHALNNPSLISRNALKNVVITSLVGNAISGSASSLELAQNTWVMLNAHKQGYSPRASIAFVKNIVGTTNTLFDEREHLAAGTPSQRRRRAYELEDIVLHRIRQQLLFEFSTWSCQSRGQAWRENTFYGIDALQNFTRMSAAVIALRGFTEPQLGGTVAISTLVANSVATINPLLCGVIGLAMRQYQLSKLSKEFSIDRPVVAADQSSAQDKPNQLQNDLSFDKQNKLLEKASFLSDKSERFDVVLDRETKEIERLRRVAQQQIIAGPLIGLTSIPAALLGTIAFYDYRKDRNTTNKLLFSGRISTLSGQAYALIQTPWTLISGMVRNRRLDRLGQSPSQLLEERLRNLDALEEQIRTNAP